VTIKKVLKTLLTKLVSENRTNWDEHMSKMLFSYRTTYKATIVTHLTILERLKCESESENNRIKSWGMFLNSQHFKGKGHVRTLG
jgi:hypothetical protein